MNNNVRRTLGVLSILTVVISVIFFLIVKGPEANLMLGISVFTILSVLGVIFAIGSRKWPFIITGIVLNSIVLVFAFFLLLSVGISGS